MINPAPVQTKRRLAMLAATTGVLALALSACSTGPDKDTPNADGDTTALTSVNIIAPADPGGGWDATARAIQSVLTGDKIVSSAPVENIGGAGGTRGLASINSEEPNTLFVTGLVMVGAVETNNSAVRIEDTTTIARLTEEPLVFVVPAASEYKTLKELVDAVIANGKSITITGGSAGGADHILAAMLLTEAGIPAAEINDKLNYVSNSGGAEAVTMLLGNKVSAGVSGIGEFAEHIAAGTLRALAVSSPKRSEILADVPTIIEAGYDVELTNWRGLLAPGKITDVQRGQLETIVQKLHDSQAWKDILAKNGWADAFMIGSEFENYVSGNITDIKATLKAVGLID